MEPATPRSPRGSDAEFDVVVIAASAGGLRALTSTLAPLPSDFPAPIVIVQHVWSRATSVLPELLSRTTELRVKHARAGERLRAGTVYIAPPGRHLLISRRGTCEFSYRPPVNFARPAADPLFDSAVRRFGDRTLGVVLTGHLHDGTAGAVAIRSARGIVIAQEPSTCRATGMPETAIRAGAADLVVRLESIGAALVSLVRVPGVAAMFGVGRHRSAA